MSRGPGPAGLGSAGRGYPELLKVGRAGEWGEEWRAPRPDRSSRTPPGHTVIIRVVLWPSKKGLFTQTSNALESLKSRALMFTIATVISYILKILSNGRLESPYTCSY